MSMNVSKMSMCEYKSNNVLNGSLVLSYCPVIFFLENIKRSYVFFC